MAAPAGVAVFAAVVGSVAVAACAEVAVCAEAVPGRRAVRAERELAWHVWVVGRPRLVASLASAD